MKFHPIQGSGFRALSSEEIKAVSGGEIVVYGNPIPPLISGVELDNILKLIDNYYGGPDGGTGYTGGGSDDDTTPPEEECSDHESGDGGQEQSEEQRAAEDLGEDIVSDDQYSNRELGGIIYNTGEKSGVLEGQASSISLGEFAREIDRAGKEWSDVKGLVHSHPANLYLNEAQFNIGKYPTGQDWTAAESAIANGANPNDLSLFIVGPDDVIREFKFADRVSYTIPYIDPNLPTDEQLAILDAFEQSQIDGENLPYGIVLGNSPC